MGKQNAVVPQLNKRFLLSLLLISLTICLVEMLVMLILDFYQAHMGLLPGFLEGAVDAVLMSLFSAPLVWFLVLRKLVGEINYEQQLVLKQTKLNTDLRSAVDSHALVSVTDIKGRIIHANSKFCEVSGYALDELLGKDHRILNSGYHDKDYIRNVWETIAQGGNWQGIFCNRNKNGGLYWVETTIKPLLDENGAIYQYISIRQDVTAQKAANEQLIMLKRALNACTDMIFTTDAKGIIQYVNPALCQNTGWTEAGLIGSNPNILDSPNADSQVLASMKQALLAGGSWSGRILQRRKGTPQFAIAGQANPPDSLEFWAELSITPVLNRNGTVAGYVQIQRDVNEQVLGEALRQMENDDTAARLAIAEVLQQNQALEQRCAGVLEILFGLNVFALQSKAGIFLRAADEDVLEMFVLRGEFSEEFIEREKRVAFGDCLCGRAAMSGELIISDDCFCDPRHEHRFEGMKAHGHYIVPISVTGNIIGVMFLYTDPYPARNTNRINMLKQVGEMLALAVLQERAKVSLENARDLAMQTALAKSEFLANMSHEIRTPMNGVLGMLDLLRDTDMSRNQWDLLETAYASAEALLAILNDILDFSKLEAGKLELESVHFNLAELIEDVCTLLAGRAHSKDLELNCFMQGDMPKYWQGDPTRIRQIVTNLLGNAIKFTEAGEVSVTVDYDRNKPATERLIINVKDTGIGIPGEIIQHLFQPFAQAESSTARRFGGTGLGLSISKTLVELMGGVIGLESTVGKGTCFWFILPLEPVDQINEAHKLPVDIIGKRLLVVDDNATNRTILEHYLLGWGFVVGKADNGKSALVELSQAYLANKPYDLALLDMHMPEMDGMVLSLSMMEMPELCNLPRILLSSGGLISEAERRKSGFKLSLLKPIKQAQLFDAVVNVLNSAGSNEVNKPRTNLAAVHYPDKKLLVVEDNKVNQKVIFGMLDKFKLIPEIAENGQQALDKLIQNTYDLVLMDCQMPVMDGYQATRQLRQVEKNDCRQHQVIIALTAHAIAGEREKCLAAGMDDYLTKPVTQENLAQMLGRWLGPQCVDADIPPIDTGPMPAASLAWDRDAALKGLADDEALLNIMVSSFLEEAPSQLDGLRNAQRQDNLAALADAAHKLKGSVSYLCAEKARGYAADLENAARGGQAGDYARMTEMLIGEVERLRQELGQFLTANPM